MTKCTHFKINMAYLHDLQSKSQSTPGIVIGLPSLRACLTCSLISFTGKSSSYVGGAPTGAINQKSTNLICRHVHV